MKTFEGNLFGQHFEPTEAESPAKLYQCLVEMSACSHPPMEGVRCWLFYTDTETWIEFHLTIPTFYDRLKDLFEGYGVTKVEFRKAAQSSPNTSPDNSPSKDSNGTGQDVGLRQSFSTISRTSETIIDFESCINDMDPFTLQDVKEIEDPIAVFFPKRHREGDVLCMSLESLENFVRTETEAGKNIFNLELKRVTCKGGRQLSFIFNQHVWMALLLQHSRKFRPQFRDYLLSSTLREASLEDMKADNALWEKILFWASDLLDFASAQERLTIPWEDGVTPFMTPYYFSKDEADTVGKLMMPNTISLQQIMQTMLEEKASAGSLEVCTSHDIFPLLAIAFQLPKGFHKQGNFMNRKKAWLKKREKEMKGEK